MNNLLRNENTKIYKRAIVWVFIILIVIAAIVHTLIEYSYKDKRSAIDLDWRNTLIGEIEMLQEKLQENRLDSISEQEIQTAIKTDQFRLDNEIKPSDWRYRVVSIYFSMLAYSEQDSTERASELLNYIKSDDWQSFLRSNEEEFKLAIENYDNDSYPYMEAKIHLDENDLRIQYNIKPTYNNWKHILVNELTENKINILSSELLFANDEYHLSEAEVNNLQDRNKLILYRIKHDYPEVEHKTMQYSINSTIELSLLVCILMIILTSLSIANEYSYGTLLQLFSYPYKRYKILYAKVMSLLIINLLFIIILFTTSILSSGILFGFDIQSPYLLLNGDNIYEINYIFYVFIKYILSVVEIFIYITITIAISVATRNAAIAIGITSLPAVLAKPILESLTIDYKIRNLNLVPFASFDFTQFLDRKLIVSDLSLPMALTITLLSMFVILTYSTFKINRQDL